MNFMKALLQALVVAEAAYISHHVSIDTHEFRELAVSFIDLTCLAPETHWDTQLRIHGHNQGVIAQRLPL
jgi:hypothetical protein